MKDLIKNKIKEIPIGVKAAVVYTLASVFSKGLAIITVPIFTRIMSISEIGIVNLYNSWYSMLNVIVTLSLTSGGYVAALKEFENERDEYQSSVLSLTSLMALVVAMIYFINTSFWNKLTGLRTELMILMIIGFLFAPAYDFWLARQRYEYKYKLAGGLSIGSAFIASLFAVFVVVKMGDLEMNHISIGRLYATNSVSLIISFAIWVALLVRGKTFYNKKYWKYSLAMSLPLIGYALATQVLSVSDRMMISRMVDNGAVGIYSTLYTVSSLSLIVWSAINSSFVPYLYENIDKENNEIKKVSLMLIGAYAIVAVLLTLLAPEIIKILATDEYYEAIYIMPPIAAGVFLTSISNMYTNILIYYKKTKYIMYASIIAAVVNVILNLVFISRFGYMAAAYTTLVAYIVLAGCQAFCAKTIQNRISGKSNSVYNDKAVMIIAMITIITVFIGLILYKYSVIRYLIIIIATITCIFAIFKVILIKNKRDF